MQLLRAAPTKGYALRLFYYYVWDMKNVPYVVILVVIALIVAPVFGSFYNLFVILATDNTGEFVKLTGYGFAIFLGLSTMLFNWSKSSSVKPQLAFRLNQSAINSVFCAVGFLISNLIKYVSNPPGSVIQYKAYINFNTVMPVFTYMVYVWLAVVAYLSIHIIINMVYAFFDYKKDS